MYIDSRVHLINQILYILLNYCTQRISHVEESFVKRLLMLDGQQRVPSLNHLPVMGYNIVSTYSVMQTVFCIMY